MKWNIDSNPFRFEPNGLPKPQRLVQGFVFTLRVAALNTHFVSMSNSQANGIVTSRTMRRPMFQHLKISIEHPKKKATVIISNEIVYFLCVCVLFRNHKQHIRPGEDTQ